jgi:NTE family protein
MWDVGLASIYLGTSLEYGNAWETRSEVDIDNGIFAGSVFLGANTGIGPLYLGYGLAEGGTDSFYLYVGALRNSPPFR